MGTKEISELDSSLNLSSRQRRELTIMKKGSRSGHGGPVILQTFDSGKYCEEVRANREVVLELRCCTEQEIDQWTKAKKPESSSSTSLGVLVSVEEDSTCSYWAKVCTPLLCPEPGTTLKATGASSSLSDGGATSTTTTSTKDPVSALLDALLGDGVMDLSGGLFQVVIPDEIVGEEFDELLRVAQNGGDFMNHPSFERVKKALNKSQPKESIRKMKTKDLLGDEFVDKSSGIEYEDGLSIREILAQSLGKQCLLKKVGWWTYEFCYAKHIRQYHGDIIVDASTGTVKEQIQSDSEHLLGRFEDYPPEDEHLHVVNATNTADTDMGPRKNKKQPEGNGAIYVQEYNHGDVCNHEEVAKSVIKGRNDLRGAVERSSTIWFSCGERWELVDIKEDSTCHYILDVTVAELCQHELFKASDAQTKTQVVKCLPV